MSRGKRLMSLNIEHDVKDCGDYVEVTRMAVDGVERTMSIHMDIREFEAAFDLYKAGAVVQTAFAVLSVDEREFLLSGLTPEAWKAVFGEGE